MKGYLDKRQYKNYDQGIMNAEILPMTGCLKPETTYDKTIPTIRIRAPLDILLQFLQSFSLML